MGFTHKLPVPLAKPGHVSIRKGGAYGVDFAALKANRLVARPKRKAGNKGRSAACNETVSVRFPGSYMDNITQVGMR